MLDAMRDVVAQDFFLDTAKRGARGGDLRHHVDAIAVGRDHFADAAHLTLHPFQPFLAR